ncbi:sec-independent protein translocase protein TatB [Cricetibacter osteomyelitidis]|uniref:Sec-independent protein translocase protein TatB n=1 Tax=Cricetibacter osteomyelitidis TaxID=1521931 RepID=A0A4R2TDJ2_9PAST|nr:Sec-independent protein translocase protein TatB [Cricetibacter osteomyelitidis]TCP95208.1 sec-independent protein translocase protein TatB [Cricetibacter osteomyelitidis]
MFDIGFSELVLIFIVGLVVLGPQRMPVAIRTVMGWVRTLRGLAANVQNELTQELKLQELQDSIKKAEQLNLKTLSPELSKTVEELKASAQKMQANLNHTASEMDADIAAAKVKVQNAIDTDMANAQAPKDTESESVEALAHCETAELSPDERAELAEQDEIMAHVQQYETEDSFESAPTVT